MSKADRQPALAALVAARDRLEAVLHAGGAVPASAEGRELAEGVHKSWQLVNEAIEHLCAGAAGDGQKKEQDGLTHIRGMEPALAQHLASLGIIRFADRAESRLHEVRNISGARGLKQEISRQNWTEQVAFLEQPNKSRPASARPDVAVRSGKEAPADGGLMELLEATRASGDPIDEPSALALDLASQTLNLEFPTAPHALQKAEFATGAHQIDASAQVQRNGAGRQHRCAVDELAPSVTTTDRAPAGLSSQLGSHLPGLDLTSGAPNPAERTHPTREADGALNKAQPHHRDAAGPANAPGFLRRIWRTLLGN